MLVACGGGGRAGAAGVLDIMLGSLGSALLAAQCWCTVAATGPLGSPPSATGGWAPRDASGATRYSVLGLFPAPGPGLSKTTAAVTKHPRNPLFGQDRPWEPRLDNGYPNVVFDTDSKVDGPWRLWYGGLGWNLAPGQQFLYYANSTDGLTPGRSLSWGAMMSLRSGASSRGRNRLGRRITL